ncbi:hypothetical protein LMG27177_07654 [Paraburkholderia fynbosensis]|uniref:Uncharacterized protein n=1 Tax=Paraburkholderia fynbosensis TaxID=1200993 RepID=A0A6J5H1Y9_9BURK|nr:hypothetical protein LMG27177_07654 [Paraburkholderia fynbosensis]
MPRIAPRMIGQLVLLKSTAKAPAYEKSMTVAFWRVSSLPHSYIVTPYGANAAAIIFAPAMLS